MSTNSLDIQSIFDFSNTFYLNYIQKFQSEMDIKKFNKFRLYFLNILTQVILKYKFLNQNMNEFLNDEKIIQRGINLIQIAFNVWNKISNDEKIKNDIFIFFFIASCFIVINVHY